MTYTYLVKTCPKDLTISQTIRWLRRRWHTVKIGFGRVLAKDINYGSCHDFATAVLDVKGWDKSYLRTDLDYCGNEMWPGHWFIKVDGLFYDSESPDGVANPKELAIFKRWFNRKVA